MADEAPTSAPADAPVPPPTTEPTESLKKPTSDETNGDAATITPDGQTAAEPAKLEESTMNGDKAQDAEAASGDASAGSKDKKRKSLGGVPEHKNKKLNKKKSMLTLHLDCKPGEFYWARLKGYPPWPSVVCDEEMLPESLLATRPVSTARPDGSIRPDFEAGGKNAKERTFPIMFLSTNEFQWMVNTNLTPLDPQDCKTIPQSKMTKALQSAYVVAAENHPLEHFKNILRTWQDEEEAIRREQEEAAAEAERLAAEKAANAAEEGENGAEKPKKKKAARKSKAADGDVDMDDADAPKSAKKRKKDAESDADGPKKTPKITKLNAPKTPNGEASASKKSTSKQKKKVVTAPKVEQSDESKPQLTEEEKLQVREKAVLYLRHRLQKGFLSRDQAPQESEMAGMAEFFGQLEAYEDLEPQIIRATKIHKVLKAIIKLASIPKDAEYEFKKRSSALLEVWNKRMEAEGDAAPQLAGGKTNGDSKSAAKAAAAEPTNETKDTETKAAPSVEEAKATAQQKTEKQTEEEGKENADDIEAKVTGNPSAIAPLPDAPAENSNSATKETKPEAGGDISMQDATDTTTA